MKAKSWLRVSRKQFRCSFLKRAFDRKERKFAKQTLIQHGSSLRTLRLFAVNVFQEQIEAGWRNLILPR